MPLTYSQTAYSDLTITGSSPNQQALISYSGLDYNTDIGDTLTVYNDTTLLTDGTGGSTVNYSLDTTNKKVVLKTNTFTGGTTISVYRIANKTARTIDFANASVLTEADLDNSALQTFHVAQEALDTAESSITADSDGTFNAGNKRIKNLAAPTSNNDAARKVDIDSGIGASVTAVGNIASNVTTVAGQISPTNNIATVAGKATEIQTVADLEDGTTATGGISAVAGKATEIGLLGTNPMANSTDGHLKVLGTSTVVANIATVAGEVGAITSKVSKSGDTMTGLLTLSGAPASANHAATKTYVDTQDTTTEASALSNSIVFSIALG